MMANANTIKIKPKERKGGKGKRSKGFINFPMVICVVVNGYGC